MAEPSASETSPSARAQPAVSALRVQLEGLRAQLAEGLMLGLPGVQLSGQFGDALSHLLGAHAQAVLTEVVAGDQLALVAVGGLGRNLQFPYSDLDLVLLCPEAGTKDSLGSEEADALMRELLHPLWDAGIKVNAVLRSSEDWLDLAAEDLTACTALLDIRALAGKVELVEALREEAQRRFFGERRAHFLERIGAEVRQRHSRYGSTVYTVEPDLKYGRGGVRDLSAVDWALRATYGVQRLETLVEQGRLGAHVAEALAEARDKLVRLRIGLHLAAGRAQDRLVFRYQEAMPRLLGMLEGDASEEVSDARLVEAIEAFMQDYYRSANDVARHGVRVFARCLPPREGARVQQRLDERFMIVDGRVLHSGTSPFQGRPSLALDCVLLAQEHQARIGARTADAIAEALADPAAEKLADDPRAQRRFLDILVDPRVGQGGSALDMAFDLGVIERMVPEFAASRGRMQHDSFHVYTVDQHSLYAVGFLKALWRGEHRKDYPLATAVILGIDDLRPLLLSTLLHDVGKAFGEQCEEGARIVGLAAQRAGFGQEDTHRCASLVREHLTMPLLSQKRDLSDPLLIAEFSERIGNRRELSELYLLSLADMATVSPGFLTSWKRTLLDELFLAANAFMRRGDLPFERLERPDEPQGLPARYDSLFDLELRRHHRTLIDRHRDQGGQGVLVDVAEGAGHLRLTVVTADRKGLLADLAAGLHDFGLDVAAADIFTVPGDRPVVLDVFRVHPGELEREGLAARLSDDLEARLRDGAAGGKDWADPGRDPGARPKPKGRTRSAETQVRFSTDPAGTRSLVEVEGLARPGVLARISAAFAECDVDILVARLTSEGDRVHDVFYVDLLSEELAQRLSERIQHYLQPRRN